MIGSRKFRIAQLVLLVVNICELAMLIGRLT